MQYVGLQLCTDTTFTISIVFSIPVIDGQNYWPVSSIKKPTKFQIRHRPATSRRSGGPLCASPNLLPPRLWPVPRCRSQAEAKNSRRRASNRQGPLRNFIFRPRTSSRFGVFSTNAGLLYATVMRTHVRLVNTAGRLKISYKIIIINRTPRCASRFFLSDVSPAPATVFRFAPRRRLRTREPRWVTWRQDHAKRIHVASRVHDATRHRIALACVFGPTIAPNRSRSINRARFRTSGPFPVLRGRTSVERTIALRCHVVESHPRNPAEEIIADRSEDSRVGGSRRRKKRWAFFGANDRNALLGCCDSNRFFYNGWPN